MNKYTHHIYLYIPVHHPPTSVYHIHTIYIHTYHIYAYKPVPLSQTKQPTSWSFYHTQMDVRSTHISILRHIHTTYMHCHSDCTTFYHTRPTHGHFTTHISCHTPECYIRTTHISTYPYHHPHTKQHSSWAFYAHI